MAELPNNAMIYGFSFIDDLSEIDMNEIHENLIKREVLPSNVIFSTWDDKDTPCTWLVASNRYLVEFEVRDVIDFIQDNNIEDEYLLIEFGR